MNGRRDRGWVMLMVVAVLLPACNGVKGSGKVVEEKRTVGAFSQLSVGGAFTVSVTVGKKRSVTLSGDDNLLKLVATEVADQTLKVRTRKNIRSTSGLTLTVTTPTLTAARFSGAVKGEIEELAGDRFDLTVSGAASVKMTGAIDALTIKVSGAASLDAEDVVSKDVSVDLSGAGEATVHASTSLDATVSGVGTVRYKGKPKISKQIQGSGSVVPLD